MSELREGLPPLPARMRGLPIESRGFPVPWFVANINGEWDFRVIREGGIVTAVKRKTCWLCGHPLGRNLTFVIGPMCAINRTISEPPSHLECAEFAVRACPFLTVSKMERNERRALPEGTHGPAGVGLKRNPGVTCLWNTRAYWLMRVDNGVLFRLGEPESVSWWAHGRSATRAEVETAIDSGLPLLRQPAEEEGPEAVAALTAYIKRAEPLLPVSP